MSVVELEKVKTFKPKTEEEYVSTVLENNNLEIQGGGTRAVGRLEEKQRHILSTTGLNGIIDYEPAEMVMIAKAGTPVADIEKALDKGGQRMIFEPLDYRGLLNTKGKPTIGGIIASNASGPRRFVAGACRDSFLGARFINGKGDIIKAGGRVMKNVTGLDLIKLLCGSWGTLAPMTEVTFKVVPKVEVEATLVLSGLSDEKAAQAMAAAMATSCEVTGAAHLPENIAVHYKKLGGKSATLLRLEGFEKSVRLRVETLQSLLSAFGEHLVLGDADTKSIWSDIRDVKPFADGSDTHVWRISVAPMAGHRLVEALGAENAFYDWQGGLVWLNMREDAQPATIRDEIAKLGGGHATLIRASNEQRMATRVFQPENEAVTAISKRIREQFDPMGKFYTGRMN